MWFKDILYFQEKKHRIRILRNYGYTYTVSPNPTVVKDRRVNKGFIEYNSEGLDNNICGE